MNEAAPISTNSKPSFSVKLWFIVILLFQLVAMLVLNLHF